MDTIIEIDHKLFVFLNSLHADWLDPVMQHISGKYEWIPLYAILLFLIVRKYKMSSIWIVLGVVLLITATDQISVKLFKELFERLRPCHHPQIKETVHLINGHCGGKYGFVSSHAANTFGLATYLGLFLKKHFKYSLWLLLGWAAVVSYSRIYLGVHYPLDIAAGGALGMIIGMLIFWGVFKIVKRYS